MLQAGRSQIRIPVMSLNFFNLHNHFNCTIALGFTEPVTKRSTRSRKIKLLGSRTWLTTLSSSVSRLYRQCGILNISWPYRSTWPVTRKLYFFLLWCNSMWTEILDILTGFSLSHYMEQTLVYSTVCPLQLEMYIIAKIIFPCCSNILKIN
jgi:hypothetical protein